MYIFRWYNGEDVCILLNLEILFLILCKFFVFYLMLKNVLMFCFKEKERIKIDLVFFYSYVKGRVLVVFVDGIIFIFYRDIGILFFV